MQASFERADCFFQAVVMFFLLFLFFSNEKSRILLVIMLTVVTPIYGCAAGQVIIASSNCENTNCDNLDYELGRVQARILKLESAETTERDIRNFILGVGGFIIPPLGIINAALFLSDYYRQIIQRQKH